MGNRNHPQPVQVPVINPFYMNVFARDENGNGILGIEVSVRCDNGVQLEPVKSDIFAGILVPETIPAGWGGFVLVKCPGYKDLDYRIQFGLQDKDNPNEWHRLTQYVNTVLERSYPFEAESGWLSRDGGYIFNSHGDVWSYRGATQFLLFRKFKNGEDIRPNLVWLREHGFNIARVLGPVDWDGTEDYRDFSNADFDTLDQFFNLLADYGLRCEWVPITTKINAISHRWLVLKSYEVASRHWNVNIEVCNEPDKDGKCDPISLLAGISTERVVTSYGKYVGDGIPWAQNKFKDYLSYHSPRDYPKFARNAKDLLEMKDALGCPVIDNEPIGVAEKDENGRRTTDIDAIVDHFAIAHLYSCGCCYHFQAGLEGRIPNESEPIQEAAAVRLCALYQFISPLVQTGHYSNPGGGGLSFPVKWANSDSKVTHAYASILGGEAYVVNPLPTNNWEPIGINGWTVVNRLDRSVIRLTKG